MLPCVSDGKRHIVSNRVAHADFQSVPIRIQSRFNGTDACETIERAVEVVSDRPRVDYRIKLIGWIREWLVDIPQRGLVPRDIASPGDGSEPGAGKLVLQAHTEGLYLSRSIIAIFAVQARECGRLGGCPNGVGKTGGNQVGRLDERGIDRALVRTKRLIGLIIVRNPIP